MPLTVVATGADFRFQPPDTWKYTTDTTKRITHGMTNKTHRQAHTTRTHARTRIQNSTSRPRKDAGHRITGSLHGGQPIEALFAPCSASAAEAAQPTRPSRHIVSPLISSHLISSHLSTRAVAVADAPVSPARLSAPNRAYLG